MKPFLIVASLMLLLLCGCASKTTNPRLAVVIVIDQFPQYFLEENYDLFGEGGFKRLMDDGAMFKNTNYSHAVTQTGPGHANIGTGGNPHRHGIVANVWYDSHGARRPCVSCEYTQEITSLGMTADRSACPDNLAKFALGDLLQAADSNAKVWSVSLKDRSAILMAGKKPDGAFWFSSKHGEFITSTYYATALPKWCEAYNKTHPADKYFGKVWERMLPDSVYSKRCDIDDASYETGGDMTNVLPKTINGGTDHPSEPYYDALEVSPFGNEIVLDFAKKTIESESLGKDEHPDLMWVSLSSNDLVGHTYGPHSHEILDMIVRTDKQIADFLEYLDSIIGKNNYVVALSSDHGVAPAPESKLTKTPAGRLNFNATRDSINQVLNHYLPGDSVTFVESIFIPYVYLNPDNIKSSGSLMNMTASRTTIALRGTPGIEKAYMIYDLTGIYNLQDPELQGRILRNYYEGRSAQIYMHVKYGWIDTQICTTHGSTHDYDTHVPMIFYGTPFKKGHYDVGSDPCDIAVTLAPLLGLEPLEDVDGHIREECLKNGILKKEK